MAYLQWMITNISLLIITVIALVGNSLVLFLILLKQALRKNSSNYLIAAVTAANFPLCVVSLPYETILIVGLKAGAPNLTNFSAAAIIYSSTPLIGSTTLCSVLTFAIAYDRLHALTRPISYRTMNHKLQAVVFCMVGILLGLILMLINVAEGNIHLDNPGCAAGGCFWSEKFRVIWTIEAVILKSITTLLSVAFVVKLRQYHKLVIARRSQTESSIVREDKTFAQANMIALYVLASSTVFITLPSLVSGLSTITGSLVFQKLGPFVAYGIFCAATFNVFIYGYKHREIRKHLRVLFSCKTVAVHANAVNLRP